jgi:hypothetical protein
VKRSMISIDADLEGMVRREGVDVEVINKMI